MKHWMMSNPIELGKEPFEYFPWIWRRVHLFEFLTTVEFLSFLGEFTELSSEELEIFGASIIASPIAKSLEGSEFVVPPRAETMSSLLRFESGKTFTQCRMEV